MTTESVAWTIEDKRRAAIDALHAWHHACIRQAADDIREDVRRGAITDEDEVTESIEGWAESLTTYTFNAQLHLTASRHDAAYVEEFGAEGQLNGDGAIRWEMLAAWAIVADIRDQLGDDVDHILAENDRAGEDVI